jgi:phosphatidylserine/phosphatidylglycerophosphate/cardiolipin synthase-like enzyme
MARFAQGKIEVFAGPRELDAPDDLERVIIDFIRDARKSLDIAVQELDNELIAQAILDAAFRGVSVRMFMEQDYLKADKPPKAKPKQGEAMEQALHEAQWEERRRPRSTRTNRDILTALLRCGVDVKADLNPYIFHQKFIVRDYRNGRTRGRAALLTGSTNFTRTGTHRNLNHAIVFHDHRICRPYAEEFQELMDGSFGVLRPRSPSHPRTVNIKGVPVRILFAPDDAPELEIVKQMLKARERLDFAIFTFSGSSGIDDAMIMLRRARILIRGILDKGQGGQEWAATEWLHHEGIEVYLSDPVKLPGLGKLHHKLMVIDDDIVVAGSMNYTRPANAYNDENIFVLGSPYDLPKSKGGPVDHAECGAITAFFRREIDRIIKRSTVYG